MVSISNKIKKKMCYYKSRTSRADVLMLREMVSFCDKEATRTMFINGLNKKRSICGGDKCLEKLTADLNILKQEQDRKKATEKKLKRLRVVGLSDSEIYQGWDKLK